MPVRVPHHPGHQVGVQVGELTRETLRDMVNRDAFGIGGHHLQRAGPGALVNHATDALAAACRRVDDAATPNDLGACRAEP